MPEKQLKADKGESKKLEIIEAASVIISQDGPSAVNFNTLAQTLKTNRAHIRYYFSSSDEIILACFENLFKKGQETTTLEISQSRSTKEKIRAYVRGAFGWHGQSSKRMSLMLLFLYYCRMNPDLKKLHSQMRREGHKRISEILNELSIEKKERESRAETIQNLITGAILADATTDLYSFESLMKETEKACIKISVG